MKSFIKLLVCLCISVCAFAQTTDIIPLSVLQAEDKKASENLFCEYPDIALDKAENEYIVFTKFINDREMICMKIRSGGTIIRSLAVSTDNGYEFRPRVFMDDADTLWITWAAKRENKWNILLRSFHLENGFGPEQFICNTDCRDMNPEIIGNGKDKLWIVWESAAKNDMDIRLCRICQSGDKKYFNISRDPRHDLRPALAVDSKDRLLIAWNRHEGKNYTIQSRFLKNDKLSGIEQISCDCGFNQVPAVAFDHRDRWVVAWQSNLRPEDRVGLTAWIHLRRQGYHRPVMTTALPGDWFKTDEEQCFEFPEIVFDKENRLWIFGRPSQGFYAQCIDGNKVSDIYSFHVPAWGGRGQYAKVAVSPNGEFISARRDWRHMYINRFDPVKAQFDFPNTLTAVNSSGRAVPDYPAPPRPAHPLRGGQNTLFGDIHQHSSLSDGRGTVDEHFVRSHYCYGQDFCAVSDHEWFVANYLTPSEWERIKILGQLFSIPDTFTVLPGYEWTTPRTPKGYGHKNVYFDTWDKQVFSWKFDEKSSSSLFDFCRENGAIAIPHHVGWTGTDWENHARDAQPVSEIVSSHGAFEYMGNRPLTHRGGVAGSFVQDGYALNCRFGVIGGSDAHGLLTHHGISMKTNEWLSGLAGVHCKNNDLPSIIKAIKSGQCYATSGQYILMDLEINGTSSGGEIIVSDAPAISMEVSAPSQIKYVTLVRDNKDMLNLGKDFYEGCGVRKTVSDRNLAPGAHWYYLRVELENGEMAWSSPIWVKKK